MKARNLIIMLLVLSMTTALLGGCGNTNGGSNSSANGNNSSSSSKTDSSKEESQIEGEQIGTTDDALSFADSYLTELNVTLDGQALKVDRYIDLYLTNTTIDDQKISIYVPEGATADSPIILCVNNSGWLANSFNSRTQVKDGQEYSSSDDADKVGEILSNNYVLVSYGARSRNNPAVDGVYDGHAPAIITDTKAIIRYLRYNQELLPAGNTDRIIITGTSGGGALSTVVAASGNNADYYESLYEVGAAGIDKEGDAYTSTINDDVYGVIAYCPITDLPHADAAYEWTYGDTRAELNAAGNETYTTENYRYDVALSTELADSYSAYVDALGLKLDDGEALTSANLEDAIVDLMEEEIEKTIESTGKAQMEADMAEKAEGAQDWLVINDDGTFTYDYDKHLNWVASNTKLKILCAFSNYGLNWEQGGNEDTLYGTPEQLYCPFEFYSWANDANAGNGVGEDDLSISFEEYLATEEGQDLVLQMLQTNAVGYLNGESSNESTVAPYWYVRYGMNDRDSSFALETVLRYSISNCEDITSYDFGFAWLMPHKGDYDVQEAYAWLAGVLK